MISIPELNAFLAPRNLQLGNGYGGLKDKTFRIAHMGELQMDDMKEITAAVEDFLTSKYTHFSPRISLAGGADMRHPPFSLYHTL